MVAYNRYFKLGGRLSSATGQNASAFKTSDESADLRVGVFPGEEPQGGPCFPHSAVVSSPYRPFQEAASSLSLLEQGVLVLSESSPHRTVVAQEISPETRALRVSVQTLLQWVQAPVVLTLSFPQISVKGPVLASERPLEGHVV